MVASDAAPPLAKRRSAGLDVERSALLCRKARQKVRLAGGDHITTPARTIGQRNMAVARLSSDNARSQPAPLGNRDQDAYACRISRHSGTHACYGSVTERLLECLWRTSFAGS
eukprot:scaffold1289_cov274-Pinguiococcus_pyrenoidosus.AAC.24